MPKSHSILAAISPASLLSSVVPGARFGRWLVIGPPFRSHTTIKGNPHAVCGCACGTVAVVGCGNLAYGKSTSCGCLTREASRAVNLVHGYTTWKGRHPLYGVLTNMIGRCHNAQDPSHPWYGARGIAVCAEWRENKGAFFAWATENGWRIGLEIDRIDNDGPYSPGNCRFVEHKENMRNSRLVRFVEAFGERKTLGEWADDPRCVVCYGTFKDRIGKRHWDAERALTQPSRRRR